MSNRLFTSCLLLTTGLALATAFTRPFAGTVTGNVNPPEGASRAWIFSATDTLMAPVENSGHFQISPVKPGHYRLMLEAKPPYRNNVKEGILVVDGMPTNVGTIEMQK